MTEREFAILKRAIAALRRVLDLYESEDPNLPLSPRATHIIDQIEAELDACWSDLIEPELNAFLTIEGVA